MPINVMITLGLCALLALVLIKRRSQHGDGTRRIDRSVLRHAGRDTRMAEPEPRRRNRPKLGVTVTMAAADTTSGALAASVSDPAPPIDVPQVPVATSPSQASPVEELAEWNENRAVAIGVGAESGATGLRVDAPGWPSPGELAGMYGLEEFDPVPPPTDPHGSDESEHEPTFSADEWAEVDDLAAPAAGNDSDGWQPFAPATEASVTRTAETVWAEPEWDEQEPLDGGAQEPAPQWESGEWQWESTSDGDVAEVPGEDPATAPEDPAMWDLPEQMELADISPAANSERAPFTLLSIDEATQTDPTTFDPDDDDRAIAAAAIAQARDFAPHSPVVVVVHTGHPEPTRRERELETRVEELEAQLTALVTTTPSPSAPRTATRSTGRGGRGAPRRVTPATNRSRTGGASPSTTAMARATKPLTLTAVESRRLRELAARRSAPPAARQRARIVLGAARGLHVATIADRVGVSQSTVRRWISRFVAERLPAIPDA